MNKTLITPEKKELLLGIPCWAMYFLILPVALAILFLTVFPEEPVWAVDMTNILTFGIGFILVLLVFRKFLYRSLETVRKRWGRLLFAAMIAFFARNFMTNMVYFLIVSFGITQEMLNDVAVDEMTRRMPAAMGLCTVLLVPVTEELLVRGMIFAPLHKKSRLLAYIVSTVVFGGLHVIAYFKIQSPILLLVSFLIYIPSGIVLGMMYERTGSIYGPITLHILINGVAMLAS